jgi:periplasmic protein TonB
MQTLTLVDSHHKNQMQEVAVAVYDLRVKGLTSAHVRGKNNPKKVTNSYGVLALVVLVHIVAMLALINAKATQPIIKELQTPMIVSLVASPAPEPEVVPLIPAPPQPIVKQQKTIIKQQQPVPKPVAVEQQVAQPVATEVPPTPAAPIVVAKAPEVLEPPQPKIIAEPVIEPPRFGAAYLHNPAPDYPQMARRLGQQGRVLLKVLVAENGIAETVALATSSGFEKLDQAAIEAVKKWSFIPAKRSNEAISAYVLVPVKFSLNN